MDDFYNIFLCFIALYIYYKFFDLVFDEFSEAIITAIVKRKIFALFILSILMFITIRLMLVLLREILKAIFN